MPKLKTHRGAAKRFKVTGTGKIVRHQANTSHILTKMNRKRKRALRKSTIADETNVPMLTGLLPYLGIRRKSRQRKRAAQTAPMKDN